jgi:phospholipid/cholesterol/gamma-HCH transport system permease protein
MGFQADFDPAASRLRLAGDLRMADAAQLESVLRDAERTGSSELLLDLGSVGETDIGPAWLIRCASERLAARGVTVRTEGAPSEHSAYLDRLAGQQRGALPAPGASSPRRWLIDLGRSIEARLLSWLEALTFGGQLITTASTAWASLRRWRVPSVVRHVYETGVQAIPVVAVIALLISVISAYIGAQQLRPFGAEIFTVDLVAIGVLRELGVLLTAIMVAGRTGSAYAAELGVMKLNDEVDALESMGINPYEVLVLPRVLALVIALPLLTIIADAMGLAGGALLTRYLIDLPWPQFVMRLDAAIGETTFWAGLVKAPVFGLLIALTGTLRGLQVRESSRELGRLTTVAVVQSIFLVIFADAIFAIFFLEIDF